MASSNENVPFASAPPSALPRSSMTISQLSEKNSSGEILLDQSSSPRPPNEWDHGAIRDVEKGPHSKGRPTSVQQVSCPAALPKRNTTSLLKCSFWVASGVSLMLVGIFIVRHFLLPRIYRCPDGATCHGNFDPRGHIIPRLQTLMQYWLQAGTFLASIGLSELIACNAHLVLKKRSDATILSVERSVSAAEGTLEDAALQMSAAQLLYHRVCRLWQRGDKPMPIIQHGASWLGILALSQIAIGLFISFIVGFSIPDLHSTTTIRATFTYHNSFTLPRSDIRFVSNDERIAGGVLNNWLVIPNSPRVPSALFDGSLIVQDNRTALAVDSQPGGFHIKGEISCGQQGFNTSIVPLDSPYIVNGPAPLPAGVKAYNISKGGIWVVAYTNANLSGTFVSAPEMSEDKITTRQYVWAGPTKNLFPNATASADEAIFFTICNHTIHMDALPVTAGLSDLQIVNPSQPVIFSNPNDPYVAQCPSSNPFSCVAWSVDGVIAGWWSTDFLGNDLAPFSCPGGVLAGFEVGSDTINCTVNDSGWTKTLNTALSAVIFSAPLSGSATQDLLVSTEAINQGQWLIQLILPGATLVLYLACLVSLSYLRRKDTTATCLQPLDLVDVLCDKQYERNHNDIRNSSVHLL